jgi:peptide-methionine (S)-S-oxide reductase
MAQDKPAANPTKTAVFAGGCFWCMQAPFDRVIGVVETKAGFTGGRTQNPTYEEVSAGQTGHREAVEVTYDPTKVTYAQLLDVYWKQIDPTDGGGQFCDRGEQYTSAIFYNDDAEKKIAEESKMLLEADDERFEGKTVVTSIIKASTFYPAEDYHQSYYKKNPIRYKFYRGRCGRDDRLEKVWGIQAPTH